MPAIYVPPISDAGLVQPGTLERVTLYLFALSADAASLASLLDQTFTGPTDGVVRCSPAGDLVVLACTSIDWLRESDPRRGHIRYNDIAFWIPTKIARDGVADQLAFHPASIIVDQPHTMVTGRETFGLVKEMGWFTMPASPERVDHISADVWGTPRPGLEQRVRRSRLFELRRVDAQADDSPGRRSWREQLERLGLEALPLLTGLLDLGPASARTTNVVGLRQLRDPADPRLASHQSVVIAPLVMTKLHGSGPLRGSYEFNLESLHSHPLAERLGLRLGPSPVRAAAWMCADVRMDPGAVLWSYAGRPAPPRRKVAILGGGMAGLSAALALSEPGTADRFEITVYQRGWRLGGKGASGRNASAHQRIEEHGLHVWYGFYDNAFGLLRRVYAELDRPASHRFARLEDVFTPQRYVVANERCGEGWTRWRMRFDDNGAIPGGPIQIDNFLALAAQTLGWFSTLFSQLAEQRILAAELEGSSARRIDRLLRQVSEPGAKLGAVPAALVLAAAKTMTERLSRDALAGAEPLVVHQRLAKLVELARARVWAGVCERLEHDEVRMFWSVFDAATTVYIGCVHDRVFELGLSTIDDYDLRAWLRRHGAQDHPTLDQSPLVRFIYNAGFAFEDGDHQRPNFAAGAALRGMLRFLLTFKGALLYEMNGGMGDVVFAPIFELLQRRGVRFALFHSAEQLRLGAEPGTEIEAPEAIEAIEMIEQAPTINGADYRPLVEIDGVECWPSEPDWSQLRDGERLAALLEADGRNLEQLGEVPGDWPHTRRVELVRGRDFDDVILAIPPSAQTKLCARVRERVPPYDQMLRHAASVATQSYQLWFKPDLAGLGWDEPSPIFGTYVDPVDTWADLSHLLASEHWPAGAVGSLAYLCGVMPDPEGPDPRARQREAERQVADAATRYVEDHGAYMWPALRLPDGRTDWSQIHEQYVRANVEGSERYVQTPAGSTRYRLRAGESGVENLYLAGDWTDNGLNCGSIEAAVMSGLQSARALAGLDLQVIGETDAWLTELFGLTATYNAQSSGSSAGSSSA